MVAAYLLVHSSSRELQQRAGFDGWVMLLRDEFDTEDQAWPQEKLRLNGIAKRKLRRLEAGGVELDMLQLATTTHLVLDPPPFDREEERIWCIEYFRDKMYDFVHDDRELVERLSSFQSELLQSARLSTSPTAPTTRSSHRAPAEDEGGDTARPDDAPAQPSARAVEVPAASQGAERKGHTFAQLSAALDLQQLEPKQGTESGGAWMPILPLHTDEDSVDRGLPTLLSSTARWGGSM